ncbi:MAG: hypothetical protein AB4062_08880 [Crocosphaera sp.]
MKEKNLNIQQKNTHYGKALQRLVSAYILDSKGKRNQKKGTKNLLTTASSAMVSVSLLVFPVYEVKLTSSAKKFQKLKKPKYWGKTHTTVKHYQTC